MDSTPETLLKHPGLEKYLVNFHHGDILCSEGDESKDLYILLDGKLEILKGKRKIAEVTESGLSIGEISFLLETKRTATVRAISAGQAVCIPKDQIEQFLQQFPSLAWGIPRVLAERLDEGTRALHGLSEFCDQLPEAVIVTGLEGRIIVWNTPAEKLFGTSWEQMHNRPVEEIYQDPEAYRELVRELQTMQASTEKTFRITRSDKDIRYVSTSLKAMYDHHSNITGFLSLSHDVTETVKLRQQYRRIRTWLFPSIACLVVLTAVLFFLYPNAQIMGIKQLALTNQISKDYLLLKAILTDPFYARDREKIAQLMHEFFQMQGKSPAPYLGIVLLGRDKKVFGFYSSEENSSMRNIVGNTYEGITFKNKGRSSHNLLTVYHVTPEHPMGKKSVELAFEFRKGEVFLGWVVFQMDMERLQQECAINEETLKLIQIQ